MPTKWQNISISGNRVHANGFLCEDCQNKKVSDIPSKFLRAIDLWDIEIIAACDLCKAKSSFSAVTSHGNDCMVLPEMSRHYGAKERIPMRDWWRELSEFNYLLACNVCMENIRNDLRRRISECTSQ